MTMRPSSGGKYLAVTIEVYLEHHEQINGLYADFNAAPEIKLVY
jgi:putative lipoic acid-binding regulatory protein